MDSGATNNYFRASCLSALPDSVRVRNGPGEVEIKLADGKTRRVARREVSLPYTFDVFHSNDDFLVIEINYAFDCILGIPWLARYQPHIDWLAPSVKSPQDFDASEIFTHLVVAPRDWPHVTVVDGASTTHIVHRASDGPLCTICAVMLTGKDEEEHAREGARQRQASEHPRSSRMKNVAVEQWLPHANETVEQRLPHDDAVVGPPLPLHTTGAVEDEISRLEESASSSSGSDTSVSSRGSRCTKSSHRSRRRWKPGGSFADPPPGPTESVCTIEYADGAPSQTLVIEVASPPRDAKSITSLPGLSWKKFLRDLKAGGIVQVCLITDADSVPHEINSVELGDASSRPKRAEPKSAREEQSWETLKVSGNPIYETAREFADVFPDKVPATLPADRGVRHEIVLAPGAKYCVTRQWPLPRYQVKAIDDFFEGRRQVGHVRESTSPHSSPTFCVKKATGGWRIVHAFNKPIDVTIPAPRSPARICDIPLTAVSNPSGMLWEWLVMPQGLKNTPATFNRMVSHVLRPLRDFAPSYFDDIFVHSRAEDGLSAVEVHIWHLRQVFQEMRENKLYANLKKCVFCAPEIPVLGCYVSKKGVRADPEKVSSICS
ncbi:polyprotein [Phytophthora cinnamomi]|uniref:polyprotein n=1 Tax=Phytophthora cinnamomi TaxID=4785 RepID=UPI00355ABB45|nr:polyprotein [Phytophthora cinnamomi]